MPYRARGRVVQVLRNGRWVTLKVHPTPEKARRHAAALNINVRHR